MLAGIAVKKVSSPVNIGAAITKHNDVTVEGLGENEGDLMWQFILAGLQNAINCLVYRLIASFVDAKVREVHPFCREGFVIAK